MPQYTTEKQDWGLYSTTHFDWWSDNLMIDDLMYHEHYKDHYAFTMQVPPSRLADNIEKAEWIPYDTYINGETFDVELWEEYTGNIVAQRYIYVILAKLLPCDGKGTLVVLRGINIVLTAGVLLCIFNWIQKRNGTVIATIIALGMTFFIQCFAMLVKNLYWIPWTLLLPMSAMMVYMDSIEYQKQKETLKILFVLSITTCALKQLCYFEFLSAAMIAMTLPLFYIAIVDKYRLKRFIQEFIAILGGAIASFIIAFGLHGLLVCYRYGVKTGAKYLISHTNERMISGSKTSPGGITAIRQAINLLLHMPALSIRGIGRIDWEQVLVIGMISIAAIFILNGARWSRIPIELRALMLTSALSVLAPISWAVMVAPHVNIHYSHCSVMWFCGTYFFISILILRTLSFIISKFKICCTNITNHNKLNV